MKGMKMSGKMGSMKMSKRKGGKKLASPAGKKLGGGKLQTLFAGRAYSR